MTWLAGRRYDLAFTYERTPRHLFGRWLALVLHMVVWGALTMWVQSRKKLESQTPKHVFQRVDPEGNFGTRSDPQEKETTTGFDPER